MGGGMTKRNARHRNHGGRGRDAPLVSFTAFVHSHPEKMRAHTLGRTFAVNVSHPQGTSRKHLGR